MLPASPYAGKTLPLDVVRSGSAHLSGAVEWIRIGVSSQPTQLPQNSYLGDVTVMAIAMFKQGLLLTKATPHNEFWEIASGMLGPTIDLFAPGLNAMVEAGIHSVVEGAIEMRSENRERAEYFKRTLAAIVPIAFLDILEMDWREVASPWSMRSPDRHLTIVYNDILDHRAIKTFVAPFTWKQSIDAIFRSRYNCEIWAEHQAVLDSLVDTSIYVPMLAHFNESHADPNSPQAIDDLMADFLKTRGQYLTEHGVTDEVVRSKTVERALGNLERYRGLPGIDDAIAGLR